MPQLFGNSYMLPAIIVVVLLLVLVLALSVRRRGQTGKTAAGKPSNPVQVVHGAAPPPVGGPEPVPITPIAPLLTAEKAGGAPGMAAKPSDPGSTATTAGRHGARWDKVRPAVEKAAEGDPLQPLLGELLRGWGELSRDDLNRLKLYRPEKVQAAVRALALPKDLKSDKDARSRLDQLARYAADLDLPEAEPTASAPLAGPVEPSAEGGEAAEQVEAAASDETQPLPIAPDSEPALEASAAEELAAAPETVPAPPETVPAAPDAPAAAAPPVDDDVAAEAAPAALGAALAGAAAAGAGSTEAGVSLTDDTLEVPRPWGLSAPLAPTAEPDATMTDVPAPFDEAADQPPIDIVFHSWEEMPMPTIEEVAAFSDWPVAFDEPPTEIASPHPAPARSPLLGGMVRTADDLMALPAEERTEMVAFLQPSELAGVLQRTKDPELKRAVIDTLEHVSTPASLEVLRQCLEDKDPQIQMYALQAADRILGV